MNAKAFRALRGLHVMFASCRLCILRRLRPTPYSIKTLLLFISVV